jgi:hypothetical protein
MLVVISDIHLNDGTVCTATDAQAAEIFFMELEDQIQAAGIRPSGDWSPVESVDIVMLGDILDIIRSEAWLSSGVRPWDDVKKYAPIATQITKKIVTENQKFLDVFKRYSTQGMTIRVPGSTTGETYNCKINLHYMVGNHDWFPYVDASELDELRQVIRDAFGLTQNYFPWKIEEWNADAKRIHDSCVKHRVYLQHGDQYDEFNYHKDIGRTGSSLGDAIVIELITKFPMEVVRRIKAKYPEAVLSREFLQSLEELDNVRPSTHTVIYLRNVIEKLANSRHRKIVREVFYECTRSIQFSAIFKEVAKHDKLATLKLQILNFSSKWSPTCIVRMVTNGMGLFRSSYVERAERESYVRSGICDYVTYGHTHEQVTEGIGMRKDESGKYIPQIYINSSTWRPINTEIRPERKELKVFPYFSEKTMTWVAYFCDGERKGRTYEVWSGQLGLKQVDQQ